LNEGKVVGNKPVIARRHPTTLFDPAEEPLDPVASAVEIGAEAFWLGPGSALTGRSGHQPADNP